MQLIVEPDGSVRCIYAETIDLAGLGQITITRASHVEPDDQGRWFADLRPVHGPVLGPFACRSEALAAERNWLEPHWLLHGPLTDSMGLKPDQAYFSELQSIKAQNHDPDSSFIDPHPLGRLPEAGETTRRLASSRGHVSG